MARRKRKNTTEEEQQLIRQSNQNGLDGGSKAAVDGPLAPAQLQQLQKQYGNAFVQRYVADQQSADVDQDATETESTVQESAWIPDPEPLKFQSHVRMLGTNLSLIHI